MNDPDHAQTDPHPAEASATSRTTAEADAAADPSVDLDALRAENAQLKDRVLRTLADLENGRRRAEKDLADSRLYAVTNFARDVLSVADNVRRALESVPDEARAAAEGPLKALLEGLDLTERDLLNTLERNNIHRVDPKGERFDPNFHQAMFEAHDPGVPSGTVREVVQSGYRIGDRVLRPAMVGVARGGPKVGAGGPAANDEAAKGG